MSFLSIPVSNKFPWHKSKIVLSGIVYTLRRRFNTRSNRWELDIADASDNDIITGLPLLIGSDLTYQYKNTISALPVGSFFVIDNTGQEQNPTLYSFGITHELIYEDPNS